MDPITVILSALTLGANQALGPLANRAVNDAYVGLKSLIIRRFKNQSPKLAETLEGHAKSPQTYEKRAATVLRDVGADDDQEVLDRATEFLKLAEARQPGITNGVVDQINAQGGKVLVIGRDNTGTINF